MIPLCSTGALPHAPSRPFELRTNVLTTSVSSMLVQKAEVWRGSPTFSIVFLCGEPEFIDVMSLGPFMLVRGSFRRWDHSCSDVQGCWDLSNPVDARPAMPLMDKGVPVFSLVEELGRLGWISGTKKIVHSIVDGVVDPQIFDRRSAMSKRCYFQVLLSIQDVLACNAAVHSDQPQAYFLCLLDGLTVDAGLGAKAYLDKLDPASVALAILDHGVGAADEGLAGVLGIANGAVSDDEFQVCAPVARGSVLDVVKGKGKGALTISSLPSPSAAASALHVALEDALHVGLGVHMPGVAAGSVGVGLAEPMPPLLPDDDGSSSSTSSSSSTFAVAAKELRNFRLAGGMAVKEDRYKPKGKSAYSRWVGKCCWHDDCSKKRSHAQVHSHGSIEPIAYIAAWNDMGTTLSRDAHKHRNCRPTPASVAEWATALGPNFF